MAEDKMKKKGLILLAGVCSGVLLAVAAFLSTVWGFEEMKAETGGFPLFSYSIPFKDDSDRLTLVVLKKGRYQFNVNVRLLAGSLSVSVADEVGTHLVSIEGSRLKMNRSIELDKGVYTLELDFNDAFPAKAVLGMESPDASEYFIASDLDIERLEKIEENDEKGFSWPYYLYTPEKVTTPHLLVSVNNSGIVSDSMALHDALARNLVQRLASMADTLECPLLMPIFPRWEATEKIYTHALDRDSLSLTEGDLKRLDLQLLAMAEDAQKRLMEGGTGLEDGLLLFGYSASAMFANRFTLLHPEKVTAAAVGSPGGWPIAPVEAYEGESLLYPVGMADLPALVSERMNLKAFTEVPQYFFIGGEDNNDSVPYEDSFDPPAANQVNRLFGDTPLLRWPHAEALYESIGANSRFEVYPGVGHVFTAEMEAEVTAFYRNACKNQPVPSPVP